MAWNEHVSRPLSTAIPHLRSLLETWKDCPLCSARSDEPHWQMLRATALEDWAVSVGSVMILCLSTCFDIAMAADVENTELALLGKPARQGAGNGAFHACLAARLRCDFLRISEFMSGYGLMFSACYCTATMLQLGNADRMAPDMAANFGEPIGNAMLIWTDRLSLVWISSRLHLPAVIHGEISSSSYVTLQQCSIG
ncbi:hypothetical protein BV20DRAFT_687781 [Pilatotrama ljubarskyi]|nr:hypothetical protein BV20DRAFT_687781 [Pilatotrama ljubarskyi]